VESLNQYIADCQSWIDRLFNQWIVGNPLSPTWVGNTIETVRTLKGARRVLDEDILRDVRRD
jgi:hypothetical protein